MFLGKPTSRRSSKASSETFGAICGLDLYAERSQHIYTKTRPRLAILFVAGHGSRDLGVNEPMPTFYIVVVTSRANALDDKGLHSLYRGESFNTIFRCHLEGEMLDKEERMKGKKAIWL